MRQSTARLDILREGDAERARLAETRVHLPIRVFRHHAVRTRPHKGSPANPFTWAEAGEKFRRYTASILDAPRIEAIVGAVDGLEHMPDVSGLVRIAVSA